MRLEQHSSVPHFTFSTECVCVAGPVIKCVLCSYVCVCVVLKWEFNTVCSLILPSTALLREWRETVVPLLVVTDRCSANHAEAAWWVRSGT